MVLADTTRRNKMENNVMIEEMFNKLMSTAPEIITRKKLKELTGGLISEKTLANLDSNGEGIRPRMRIGGKTAYPRKAAIEWLKKRCEIF